MNVSLGYPVPKPPAQAEPLLVAPGIFWLRMPLPFRLDHINLWLIDEGDGYTLVDTGIANDATRAVWESVFAGPLRTKPLKRIVCTHCHPDHMGLAGWLGPRFGIPLHASQSDWAFCRMLAREGGDDFLDCQERFYRRAGFGPEDLALVRGRGNTYGTRVVLPPPSFSRLLDGQTFRMGGSDWQPISGRGHSPEHMCLYSAERKVLISGDQILPKISPVVGVWPQEPDANPLDLFIASLERFRGLPEDTLVLPSHGLPFTGLESRLDQLAHHHDARLDDTRRGCVEWAPARQILDTLFPRPLDNIEVFFAAGETVAHLHYLMGLGQVERRFDADGVYRFRAL